LNRRWLIAACAGVAFACTGASSAPLPPGLAAGYNAFGFHLLTKLRSDDSNAFISPASVALGLAIVTDGAAGTTRTQLLAALGQTTTPPEAFDRENARLMAALRDPGSDVQFSVANALWTNPDCPPLASFVKTGSTVFDATARPLPFGDPSAAVTINTWVKDNTGGLIPGIIDSTSKDDALIVTNAIAMRAKWRVRFEKNQTHDAPFTTSDGKRITLSLMRRADDYAYAHLADWQVVRLPYRGDRFAMYVLLPRAGLSLAGAMEKLDGKAFASALAGLKRRRILFAMPRFSATYKEKLNAPLARLGIADAFDSRADLSRMIARRASVSAVLHRTFVRVDEEGTEAAGATAAVVTKRLVLPVVSEEQMIVDRPFLMAIRDDQTGQILFLGTIVAPKAD
jgi:serpin B